MSILLGIICRRLVQEVSYKELDSNAQYLCHLKNYPNQTILKVQTKTEKSDFTYSKYNQKEGSSRTHTHTHTQKYAKGIFS